MKSNKEVPYGNIKLTQDIGDIVRASQGATQAEFAALCGVGTRFISDLENGKATAELGKVLVVIQSLGLELHLQSRGWKNNRNGKTE